MYHFILISVMLKVALVYMQQNINPNTSKIVGGIETTIEQHPYQVSIRVLFSRPVFGKHYCGGSLIKLNVVLTAAHCMVYRYKMYKVKAGSKFIANDGEVREIKRYLNHPRYRRWSNDYDVSIVVLDGSFQQSRKIKIIQILPDGKTISVGTMGTASGWGVTVDSDYAPLPEFLRKVEVAKYNHTRCKNIYYSKFGKKISDRMTCYGTLSGGRDSCQFDGGGPLVDRNKLIGIVSWGEGCAKPDLPGVYTDLANKEIRNFIFSKW